MRGLSEVDALKECLKFIWDKHKHLHPLEETKMSLGVNYLPGIFAESSRNSMI